MSAFIFVLALKIMYILCTSGLCTMFEENTPWSQLVVMIHSLLAISVFLYFIYSIGGKIKQLVENNKAASTVSTKCGKDKIRNLIAPLILIFLGFCLCIPLRHLYLTNLNDQAENMVGEVSRRVIQNDTNVYLFMNVDWLLVAYYSFLNIGFLLSFSYCTAVIIELIQEELIQKYTQNEKEFEIVPSEYFIV
jgi:hypothetical protein